MRQTKTMILCAVAIALAGCSDDETSAAPPEELSPDADACEHLRQGPFDSAAATAAAMGAPAISAPHTSWEITLLDDGQGAFAGFVSLALADAGDRTFYTDSAVDLAVTDAGGAAIALEDGCAGAACSSDCDLVIGKRTAHFTSVGTYSLELGPIAADTVHLVHFGPDDEEED